MTRRRRAASAIELLFASAVLVAAAIPIYTLFQSSQQVAFLDEFQVMARRHARQYVAILDGLPYEALAAAAVGSEPVLEDHRLSPASKEILDIPLPESGLDVTLENIPEKARDYYLSRFKKEPPRVYFEELEPGLARLAVLVFWVDPVSKKARHSVVVHFVEHPFPWMLGVRP